MPFVQFIKPNGSKSRGIKEVPISRIDKSARLYFPIAFTKKIEGRKYCSLFYDQEAKIIGVKPMKRFVKEVGYSIYSSGKSGGSLVYAISIGTFLKFFGIEGMQRNGFVTKWNGASKMLEINLDSPIPLNTKKGRKNAASGKGETTFQQGDQES